VEAIKAKKATKRELIVVATMISRIVGTPVFSDRTEFSVFTRPAHGVMSPMNAVSDVVLPKRHRVAQRFYTLDEIQRILEAAQELERTLYCLAAETGMRGGELCGLQVTDFDLERGLVRVNRSVWRGKIQSTTSEHPDRCIALSPQLLYHLAEYLRRWKPNEKGWLFATRNGTPLDQNLIVKRKLQPLLISLGINRGGLHAFRHGNISIMDRFGVPLKSGWSALVTVILR